MPVLARDDESFDHLGSDEVFVKLIQLIKSEVVALEVEQCKKRARACGAPRSLCFNICCRVGLRFQLWHLQCVSYCQLAALEASFNIRRHHRAGVRKLSCVSYRYAARRCSIRVTRNEEGLLVSVCHLPLARAFAFIP